MIVGIFIFSLGGWLKVEVQWWEAKGRNSLSEFHSRLELNKNNIFFQRTRQNQEQIFREQDNIDFSEEIKKDHTWPSTTKELGSFLRLTTRLT